MKSLAKQVKVTGLTKTFFIFGCLLSFVQVPNITRISIGELLFLAAFMFRFKIDFPDGFERKIIKYCWLLTSIVATYFIFGNLIYPGRDWSPEIWLTTVLVFVKFTLLTYGFYVATKTCGPYLTSVAVAVSLMWFAYFDLVFLDTNFVFNPWKYGWSIPVAILGLSILRGKARSTIFLLVLSVVNLALDSRAAGLVSAAAATLVTIGFGQSKFNGRNFARLVLALVLVIAAGLIIHALILQGFFGFQVAIRQLGQDQLGFLAGRVESLVLLGLVLIYPLGFGAGIVPNPSDLTLGLATLSQFMTVDQATYVYVTTRVIGQSFEVHSIFGDVWAVAGPLGLLMLFYIVRLVSREFNRQTTLFSSPIVLFLLSNLVWDFFFSPYVSLPENALFFGIIMGLHSNLRIQELNRQ